MPEASFDSEKITYPSLGLTLNEQKTCIRNAKQESFDFLGYTFGPRYWWKTGKPYLAASPSGGKREALDRIVREQAFTVLNRLAALRMAAARTGRYLPLTSWQRSWSHSVSTRLTSSAA